MGMWRGAGVAMAVAWATVGVLLCVPAPAAPARYGSRVALTAFELSLLGAINDTRAEHGLRPLAVDVRLTRAATAHSHQMVTDGYFGHSTPTGVGFLRRLEYYYPLRKTATYDVGENLYWDSASQAASGVVARWMRSPGHRANLLSPAWRQIGIGVTSVASAPGVYDGLPATVVTVDFGIR